MGLHGHNTSHNTGHIKERLSKRKIGVVLGEFKRGSLKSGSGGKVTNRKQAVAIALSEARKKS